ncbi:YcxB family protein [Paenibacillus sp. UNC496MF]|uniref:YcxB family protein n=1 Tax=Paenibacillus sp. UNC496MF TaxID=1502753 RepID=UPI001C433807|nr:YcxB family protein [Paenibacillus sp. UNC496MF]
MSLKYELTFQDYHHFIGYHGRRRRIIEACFFGLFFVAATLAFGSDMKELAYLIPIGILLSIVLYALAMLVRYIKAKRAYDSNKLIQKVQEIQFSERGIKVDTENGHSLIEWDDIYKVTESHRMFAVFTSRLQGVVIPKRLVDADRLRDIFKANMEPKKVKRLG